MIKMRNWDNAKKTKKSEIANFKTDKFRFENAEKEETKNLKIRI